MAMSWPWRATALYHRTTPRTLAHDLWPETTAGQQLRRRFTSCLIAHCAAHAGPRRGFDQNCDGGSNPVDR
jgi:hypothetical protein